MNIPLVFRLKGARLFNSKKVAESFQRGVVDWSVICSVAGIVSTYLGISDFSFDHDSSVAFLTYKM